MKYVFNLLSFLKKHLSKKSWNEILKVLKNKKYFKYKCKKCGKICRDEGDGYYHCIHCNIYYHLPYFKED